MPLTYNNWIALSALTLAAVGLLIWKKKKYVYTKVGCISKMYFYPVKSLKGIEVTEGKVTKLGFEVNGLLDRSFMLVDGEKNLLSQRQAPSLALVSPHIRGDKLLITAEGMPTLTVDIKHNPDPGSEVIKCMIFTDSVSVIDCGDEAAEWFQKYLKKSDVRLVRNFPQFPARKFTKSDPFYKKLREENNITLQDLSAIHMLSQPSIDNLNMRIGENKVSVFNFRPNILVDGCEPYAEDSWKYMKLNSSLEMVNVVPVTRCLLTTIEPNTGIMTQKEPLVTLRKYRIPKDPEMLKKTGSLPCLGTACYVLQTGEVKVNDSIFAVISKPLETIIK